MKHDRSDDAGACEPCAAGKFKALAAAECTDCGWPLVDDDSDPATDCVQCAAGSRRTGPLLCRACECSPQHAPQSTQRVHTVLHQGWAESSRVVVKYGCPNGAGAAGRALAVAPDGLSHVCAACGSGTYAPEGSSSCPPCPVRGGESNSVGHGLQLPFPPQTGAFVVLAGPVGGQRPRPVHRGITWTVARKPRP